MWAAGGLNGRLGAAKRRMLSFADSVSPLMDVEAWGVEVPLTGTADGMVDCGWGTQGPIWRVVYMREAVSLSDRTCRERTTAGSVV